MPLVSVSVRAFRNLRDGLYEVPDGLVLLLGANGAGKTNFLEAITVLGNVTSFRASGPRAWVRRGESGFQLRGVVAHGGRQHEFAQEVTVRGAITTSLLRGSRRVDTASYLELFPVFGLCGEDRQLLLGPPAIRRRFMDRLAFHTFPETLAILQRYRRALRQRNALLANTGHDRQLDAFEHDLAVTGARLCELRLRAIVALESTLTEELEGLSWSRSRVNLRYHAGGGEAASDAAVPSRLRTALVRSRAGDRSRGYTLVGPHRHDLQVATEGTLAREVLSAGQGKLLVTALKLAAVTVLERARGRRPTVVFDDVDAEFDVRALTSVLSRLAGRGQTLVSSAREELVLPRLTTGEVWRMHDGQLQQCCPEGRGA